MGAEALHHESPLASTMRSPLPGPPLSPGNCPVLLPVIRMELVVCAGSDVCMSAL